jgi:hypothetical protein
MSRVFLMKWYHFSVEYFEDLRNVNHCEFLIMRKKEDSGKYILENNLRTWSELKRERLAAAAAKEKANPSSPTTSTAVSEKDKEKEKKLLGVAAESSSSNAATLSPIPFRKKWGGCPNGCDHGKHAYRKENSMHAMQLNGKPSSPSSSPVTGEQSTLPFRRPAARCWQSSSDEDEDDPRGRSGPTVDVKRSLDEIVSSPDGTPSFISLEDRLRSRLKSPRSELHQLKTAGRDFGGSASGNTSQAGSDTEFSAEEDTRKRLAKGKIVGIESLLGKSWAANGRAANGKGFREQSGMGRGALADALGDQSDVGSDAGSEAELELSPHGLPELPELKELREEERQEKSIKGSVY